MFGSNINLDAMLQVLGKWSLSGMAIAATAKSAPKIDFQELYFWQYSTQIREQVSIPLAYLGGVKSADNVAQCLEAGFDAVALARALLREPDLPRKWRSKPEEPSLCDNATAVWPHLPSGRRCIHRPANDLRANQVLASSGTV